MTSRGVQDPTGGGGGRPSRSSQLPRSRHYFIAVAFGLVAADAVAIMSVLAYGRGELYGTILLVDVVLASPVGMVCGAVALALGRFASTLLSRQLRIQWLPSVGAALAVIMIGLTPVFVLASTAGWVPHLLPAVALTGLGACLMYRQSRSELQEAVEP